MSISERPAAPDAAATLIPAALHELSGGNVVAARGSGPVFRRDLVVRRASRRETFVPLARARDRVVIALCTAGWGGSVVAFWWWWLRPEHRASWAGLLTNSALLLYLTAMPVTFLVAVNRLRTVSPAVDVPALRVAFVVTRAPSEPWSVARTTLSAMLDQRFPTPYDLWLCDEDPGDEVLRWCEDHGVRVSCRRDDPGYHRTCWPRRTRCKEGNLAYFYDHWGYRSYDVVAQLDCDHVPAPTYLREMVRPFADPAVGYVAAPSICDANASTSWAARGRLYREAAFHGPLQAGHTGSLAPVCIGSHYAVRTQALRDIGGIGPELAEDFSTSFLLNSAGWQGAFALEAEAHGDGPLTAAAMFTQEFQWSRSLTTVLYDLVPRHLPRLSWLLKLRFLYALSYYLMLAAATVGGLALPAIAATTGLQWVTVNYFEFLLRLGSVSGWLLLIIVVLRRRGLLRPRDAPILSWELWLFVLARWPYVVWGVLAATLQKIRPRPIGFRVTPKAREGLEPLPMRLVLPYVAVILTLALAALVGELSAESAGYVFLCLLGGLSYAVVAFVVSVLHAVEAARAGSARLVTAVRATIRGPLVLGTLVLVPLVVALARYPAYAIRAFGW